MTESVPMAEGDWQVRRVNGPRIYTGLSRGEVERALRTGKLSPDDLAMPPGVDRWMKVSVALIHSGEEQPETAPRRHGPVADSTAIESEGRLIRFETDQEDPAEMDLTPMIDVTTLLPIFFLVGGVFMLQAAIELPRARGGTAQVSRNIQPVGILINLAPTDPTGGTISFEDERTEVVPIDELPERFKNKLTEGGASVTYRNEALIKAHRDVPFGLVRQVMTKLTEAGATRLAVGIAELRDRSSDSPPEGATP